MDANEQHTPIRAPLREATPPMTPTTPAREMDTSFFTPVKESDAMSGTEGLDDPSTFSPVRQRFGRREVLEDPSSFSPARSGEA